MLDHDNTDLWPDLDVAPWAVDIPEWLSTLKRLEDRVKGYLFFIGKLRPSDFMPNLTEAGWYARAALSSLGSLDDMLARDMNPIGLKQGWAKSSQRQSLQEDPLLLTLKVLRHYDIHFSYRDLDYSTFLMRLNDDSIVQAVEAVYISPFDWEDYLAFRGNKRDLELTPDHIVWFNTQILYWPALFVFNEAIARYIDAVEDFLRAAGVVPKT